MLTDYLKTDQFAGSVEDYSPDKHMRIGYAHQLNQFKPWFSEEDVIRRELELPGMWSDKFVSALEALEWRESRDKFFLHNVEQALSEYDTTGDGSYISRELDRVSQYSNVDGRWPRSMSDCGMLTVNEGSIPWMSRDTAFLLIYSSALAEEGYVKRCASDMLRMAARLVAEPMHAKGTQLQWVALDHVDAWRRAMLASEARAMPEHMLAEHDISYPSRNTFDYRPVDRFLRIYPFNSSDMGQMAFCELYAKMELAERGVLEGADQWVDTLATCKLNYYLPESLDLSAYGRFGVDRYFVADKYAGRLGPLPGQAYGVRLDTFTHAAEPFFPAVDCGSGMRVLLFPASQKGKAGMCTAYNINPLPRLQHLTDQLLEVMHLGEYKIAAKMLGGVYLGCRPLYEGAGEDGYFHVLALPHTEVKWRNA